MPERKKKMNGVILTAKIIGLLSEKPRTISEIVKEIYGKEARAYTNSAGRIFLCVETLVETKVIIPKMKDDKLKFGMK